MHIIIYIKIKYVFCISIVVNGFIFLWNKSVLRFAKTISYIQYSYIYSVPLLMKSMISFVNNIPNFNRSNNII